MNRSHDRNNEFLSYQFPLDSANHQAKTTLATFRARMFTTASSLSRDEAHEVSSSKSIPEMLRLKVRRDETVKKIPGHCASAVDAHRDDGCS
ncbi:hypothetical protein Tcan_10589 [Toxocara canis]|uniref:Uncharacterized protein n=1 Tax=Toxocara canis TaxID=6265 RepID=A0A0B2UV64_TOXCA|nr:hypothetical protein Tcan_10589 [Toxocara canis]